MKNIKKEIQSQVSLRAVLKRFLIIFLPVLVLASCVTILFYYTETENVKEERRIFEINEIDHVKLQMEMIINDFNMIISDLIIQSKHPEIQKILESNDIIHRKTLAEAFLVFCDKRGIYDQVRFLDETGMEVVRINYNKGKPCIVQEDQRQFKGKRYYFKDTFQLNKGEVFISPFDLNIEGEEIEEPLKPMIRFGTPVFDSHDQKRGVIILNFLGEKLINKLKMASVTIPGHVMLLNSKGYWLRGIKPEDEWGFMYKDRKNVTFGNTFPNTWQRISSTESGHFYNKNGLFTFVTVCPLTEVWIATTDSDKAFANDDKRLKSRGHDWKVVSYVTPEVLNLRLRTFTTTLFSIYGAFFVLIGVGSWFLARSGVKRRIAENALWKHHNHLEELVDERTDELQKSNKNLQAEIKERICLEEALKISDANYQDLYENAPDMYVSVDAKTSKILRCNQAVSKALGYSKEEIVGRSVFNVYHPDCIEDAKKAFKSFVETGKVENAELQLKCKDGSKIDIILNTSAIRDENDKIVYSRSIWHDITELKKMENELTKVQKLESVGTLAGGIAHDFNNYLQGIMSNIATVKECIETSDELYRNLANAEKAVLQATDLTKQLLTFSRGGEPVRKTISISGTIRDSADIALSGSDVICEFDIPYGLCPIEADKGQMNQVISNLLINANQAMPKGGIIKIRAENTNIKAKDSLPLKKGKYVMITFEDQGTGISKEHLQKIFDPFFTTKKEGTGLGLATTYSIIKRHGGYIKVESKVGTGTTFYIYLPASEGKISSETVPVKDRDKRNKGKDIEKATPLEEGRRILFMEDNLLISLSVAEQLRNLKYEVQTTQNGTKAIELYKSAMKSGKPFDAVVMDLTIPDDMGGKEAIKKLLKIDSNVKAVVASGYSNDPVMANFRKYGFRGVVAKPYEAYELDEILQEVIAADN